MNFAQLRALHRRSCGRAATTCSSTRSALHRKIAFPFVTLVMTLIAVPFAVTTGRRGAMYGIGVGIVLALVYWTMISVFAAFGAGGLMRSDAGGVGAEPALRRGRGLPAADGPDVTAAGTADRPEDRSADRRSRYHRRHGRALIGAHGHAAGRLRPDDPRARSAAATARRAITLRARAGSRAGGGLLGGSASRC